VRELVDLDAAAAQRQADERHQHGVAVEGGGKVHAAQSGLHLAETKRETEAGGGASACSGEMSRSTVLGQHGYWPDHYFRI
jgi:hypothetical protein